MLAFFRFCLPFLPSLLPMLRWFSPIATSEPSAALAGPVSELPPYQQDHALAAFEQGDWLAELELLQLAKALLPEGITPELLEMALKLKAAGLG